LVRLDVGFGALSERHCLCGVERDSNRLSALSVDGINPLGDQLAQRPRLFARFGEGE
jgi:hypothetical protein